MSAPRFGMGDLLDQTAFWCAREEGELVVVELAGMSSTHLANLRAWLVRNAEKLQASEISGLYGIAGGVTGEMAAADLDCAIASAEEETPQAWLESKPLFEEITRLLGTKLDETHGV